MTRPYVLLLGVAGLVLTGCGVRPTGEVSAGEGPVATATSAPQAQVVFLRDGVPVPVDRPVSPWDRQAVLDALAAGPTPAERTEGLTTELKVKQILAHSEGGQVLIVDPVVSAGVLSPYAYTQVYCTIALLPGHPEAKIISRIDKKMAAAGIAPDCPYAAARTSPPPPQTPPSPGG
jgi:hypothetical protein